MPISNQQKRKNAIIQKEQQQLLMIQKELEEILIKINDSINVLKVEELQLKSSAVVFENPNFLTIKTEKTTDVPWQTTPSASGSSLFNNEPITFSHWTQQSICTETAINRQEVDLDINRFPNVHHDIEEDDE